MADRGFEVTGEQVLEEIGRVAFAPAGDGTGAQLKYSNKLKALELLCKLLGPVSDKKADKAEEADTGATGVVLIPVVGEDDPSLTADGQEGGA